MLTVKQAADKLGCHPQTVRRAIHSGQLHAFKLDPTAPRGRYRIRPEDLEHFVRSGQTNRPVPTFAERLGD